MKIGSKVRKNGGAYQDYVSKLSLRRES